MRMIGIWLGAAALLAIPAALPAEEPHLEMIRGLRAAGEPQLALEYIQERVGKNVPPAVAQIIGLELARTRVEIARQENEEGKRLALFTAARTEFENFLKANPKHPLAPQARFEIARLTAAQGKEAVNRARRTEGDARAKALKDARPAFEAAVKQLADAAKQLKTLLDGTPNSATPEEKAIARDMSQSWLQAQLEEGMNLYLLGQTYDGQGTEELKKRAVHIGDAAKAFDKLSTQDLKNPICWLARAWLARCYFENDDFAKADAEFDKVTAEKGPHADEAKRVAAYFRILMARHRQTATAVQLQNQFQAWLDKYAAYVNTPEGCGARYFLADVLESQAFDPAKGWIKLNEKRRPVSVSAEAAAKLKQAERLLRSLCEFENDFSDRAAAKRMHIILAIAIRETPDRDPAKVANFESGYLLALLESAELGEELKDPGIADNPEKQVELRKQHYGRAVRALDRALKLVKPSDPPKEVLDARVMLVFAHYNAGNNYQAAVLGEHLARSMPRTGRGAVPALYSLQAYRNVMLDTKARGDVKEEELRTDRDQVRRMAEFMEATWPNETPTDTARYTLGMLYFADGDYLKALEAFDRVTGTFASLALLRYQQGVACFDLQKDAKAPPAVRTQWFRKVTAVLEAMPNLAEAGDPETTYYYCMARLQLGTLLLQEGKNFAHAEELGKTILDASDKYRYVGDKANEIKFSAQAVMIYGLYGRVFELVKGHHHAEAAKLYEPVVAELEKKGVPEDESAGRARQAISSLLQLAVRSSVQEGQIDRAQGMLKLLEKAGAGGPSGPLVSVLREVQAQINDMRKNDPAGLKETIDKFTSFLDTLAKQKNLSRDVKIFLAQGYASLEQPTRAIELLVSITPPAEKNPGDPPKSPPETAPETERAKYEEARGKYDAAKQAYDQAWRTYWFAQLTHVRALRAAGRLEADKEQKKKHFQAADKLLDEMIGTPQKQGWAFNSLEVRRERIFILEDQEQWRPALDAWVAMQKPFVGKFKTPPQDDKEARMRAAYYEIRFYITRLVYKSKQNLKDAKKKEADIKRLAEQVVELEKDARTADFGGANVKKLYQEWLEDEPPMRKAYEAAKGRALLVGAESTGGQ